MSKWMVRAVRLDLDPEPEFFRETTAKFLDQFAPPAEIRRLRNDVEGFDRDYWARGAELGWTSLLVTDAAGGGSISGQGIVDLSLVAHEFGMHAAPGPLLPDQRRRGGLVPSRSLLIHSWARCSRVMRSRRGRTPSRRRTTASGGSTSRSVKHGAEVVLNGVKAPVEAAASSSHLLVTGRTGDGLTQVLVPTDAPGITLTPLKSVDLTRRFSMVRFDGVRVPTAAVLGDAGRGGPDVEWQLLQAFVVLAAEGVGAMQRAFQMTVDWAFDRYSFGRPLASYQALKHRFADMKTWLEAGHAITDAATTAVAEAHDDAGKLASMAMAYVGEYGSVLLQDCVQLHGGIGLTFEHDLHLFLRRHTLDRTVLGTPADHRARVTAFVEREESS